MDVSYTLHEIKFEWDKRKADTNFRKHEVLFERPARHALILFFGWLSQAWRKVNDEAVIGMTEQWRLLYIVYVETENSIRIISARVAKKPERQFYEEQ